MTDADKLRELAGYFDRGCPSSTPWNCAAHLRRIAFLLDAVPPETLRALKAGTMVAIPIGFARFLKSVMESAKEHGGADVDGGWIQDYATDVGILVAVPVTEPCGEGENCVCAEYGFPAECYRYSLAFKDLCKALAAAIRKMED